MFRLNLALSKDRKNKRQHHYRKQHLERKGMALVSAISKARISWGGEGRRRRSS